MKELILGGQKSGKSRAAEQRAAAWLAGAGRQAVLLATAQPSDAEMAARIARHRSDRAQRVPALRTVEADAGLAQAIDASGGADTLLVVDCLTLWLTQRLMPLHGEPGADVEGDIEPLLAALARTRGPVVLVSNEIALGVVPLDAATRRFVDALGLLHQRVAARCERVTLMVAGCALAVKGPR
ncbi:MAG TPA: bifunctional adenosylcobinamide kinase/adenosylcobinamide-phosphate guanylyltransferase [Methylibium sp.]|nr:bifunctional adenosylcobinamide kinase/adenosylcobinamide-phosphate guanylyltransferase [Methylibium sp.]